MINEKQLRAALKDKNDDTTLKVWVYQVGRDEHFSVKYFRKSDIKSRYLHKVLEHLSFYHGELSFKLI
jgi:hypothetical protein